MCPLWAKTTSVFHFVFFEKFAKNKIGTRHLIPPETKSATNTFNCKWNFFIKFNRISDEIPGAPQPSPPGYTAATNTGNHT